MRPTSALAQAAQGQGTLVRVAGCAACWRYKKRTALRACGKPHPVMLAA